MIKKIIKLKVKITNPSGHIVSYSVMVDGAARSGALETTVKNALYSQHSVHSADIFSIGYDVNENRHAKIADVGVS